MEVDSPGTPPHLGEGEKKKVRPFDFLVARWQKFAGMRRCALLSPQHAFRNMHF